MSQTLPTVTVTPPEEIVPLSCGCATPTGPVVGIAASRFGDGTPSAVVVCAVCVEHERTTAQILGRPFTVYPIEVRS
jgi:hypothetical protein